LDVLDPLHPPKDRADPDGELPEAERLGEVVVRPDREPGHLVRLFGLRGQHQDGGPSVALDPLADLEAVHPGEHQVEHDQVGLVLAGGLDRFGTIGRDDDPVALALEPGSDRLGDRFLVVDDQHGLLAHRPMVRGRLRGRSRPPMEKSLRGTFPSRWSGGGREWLQDVEDERRDR
jgi:hypothetical protein